MGGMPVRKLGQEESEQGAKDKRRKKGAKSAKVVSLFARRKASQKLSLESRQQMVLEYRTKGRNLAHSILRRWHSRLDPQEVDSIVDLSLCEAVRRFDPAKGASFITFLFYHLRGNLIRAVTAAAAVQFVPLPDLETPEQAGHVEGRTSRAKWLSALEVADSLTNHEHIAPDDTLIRKEMIDLSLAACTKLDALEREVIERIYLKGQQLMDIASQLGYSRCHISRVKKRAIEAIQGELSSKFEPEEFASVEDDEAASAVTSKIHRLPKKALTRKVRSRRRALQTPIAVCA